jgi:hypothetical protein
LFLLEPLTERFTINVRHHVVRPSAKLTRVFGDYAGIDQTQNVRVLQIGGDLDLFEEPLLQVRSELRMQNFYCDFAIVFLSCAR